MADLRYSRMQAEQAASRATAPAPYGQRQAAGDSAYGVHDGGFHASLHSSLLATPASRHTGGRVTQQPSPSVLAMHERRVEAAAGYVRSPALAATWSPALTRQAAYQPSPLAHHPRSSLLAAATATGRPGDIARLLAAADGAASSPGASGAGSPAKKYVWMPTEQPATAAARRSSAAASPAAAADPLAAVLQRRASATAAAAASPARLATTPNSDLREQIRRLQLNLERTKAHNIVAMGSSGGSPARAAQPASGQPRAEQRPQQQHHHQQCQQQQQQQQQQQRQQQQQQQQQDFRIPAAFPAVRPLPGVAPPRSVSPGSSKGRGAGAAPAGGGALVDENEAGVSMQLSPVFEDMPVHAGVQTVGGSDAPASCRPQQRPATGAFDASAMQLESRNNDLEAKLRLERMRVQDATGSNFDLQQRCTAQQQQIAALRAELEATQQRATAAEARGSTAAEHAAALQQEVERRRSVHSDGVESVTRLQVVSQVQRQENEELRQHVRQLSEAWEQENAAVGRLQQQLREALGAAGSHKAAVEARLRQAEVEWQQQLAEARERAKQAEAELSSRCQMLSIEKVAHEQAANRATAEQRAAEARCEAAEARCRQLAAELGDASGAAAQVQAARQQAEAAAEAARSLRRQLLEREARCEELEGALRGEQERRHSQAARAATAEVAQAGLGSHVKATHARLQQLQDQLGAAKQEVQQLQARNDELHQAHLASSSGFEAQVSGLQSELAGVRAERDTLRQHYAKASADLDAHLAAAGQQRQRSAALQQAERELRSALEAQQAAAAEAGRQAAALQGHCQALEARTAQLEGELVEAKQRAAAAEDRLAKAGRPGAPSLQDVVGGLRQELQERDLQLMQMHEDVSRERQKVQELQKQVLDQAMELDEMQRDSSDTFALRQQVSAAQQAEAHLRKEVGQLRQQLGAASAAASGGSVDGDGGDFSPRGSVRSIGSAASPSRSVSRMGAVAALQARLDAACRDLSAAQEEIARLSADRDRLRDELDARDTEAMRLQGELSMLQRQMADEQNWLSPLPDPYG